jgi:membrane carboxypeptidase/penicillin-binding protein PbpC
MKLKQPYSKTGEAKVMLKISSSGQNKKYNWYVNNKFIKTSTKVKEFFNLKRGKNTVLVVTDLGETASVTFFVE